MASILVILVPLLIAMSGIWVSRRSEGLWQVFACMYGVGIFFGGLFTWYSTSIRDILTLESDAATFYELAVVGFSGESLQEKWWMINSPLAITIWNTAYVFCREIGLGTGVWVGLEINAIVVALAAVLTIGCLERGPDIDYCERRRSLLMCAYFCPSFWLCSGMHLRDGMVLLGMVGVLFLFVQIARSRSLVIEIVCYLGVAACFAGLRLLRQELLIFAPAVIGVFSVATYVMNEFGKCTRSLVVIIFGVLLIAAIFPDLDGGAIGQLTARREMYSDMSYGENSMGYRLVVSQAIPVRLLLGIMYIQLFPIPIWSGVDLGGSVYHWAKSFHAVFMAILLAETIARCTEVKRRPIQGRHTTGIRFFMGGTFLAGNASVALSSIETRHCIPFLPALFLLMAMTPAAMNKRSFAVRAGVVGVYASASIGWVLVKLGQ